MSLSRIPYDETLLSYAAGTMKEAPALVVETHLALCRQSRDWAATLGRLGDALWDEMPSVPIDDALPGIMARIAASESGRTAAPPATSGDMPDLPEPLLRYPLGPWRWIAPGMRLRRVMVRDDGACRAILLKVDPGRRMPQHTHSGIEYTCVIQGAYRDESGRYGPGDFEEADGETSHRPVVDSDEPCLCVVALEGGIRLDGPLGWLFQPFVRL